MNETDINDIIKDVENNMLFKGDHHLLSQIEVFEDIINVENKNYFNLNSQYIKAAVDTKIGEKYRIKSNLIARKLNGSQHISSVRQFFSNTSFIQDFSQFNTQHIRAVSLNNTLAISLNPTTNFEAILPISFTGDITNRSENGAFRGTSYQNESNHIVKQFAIAPIYKFHKNFPNDVTLSIFGANKYTVDAGNFDIISKDSIAGDFIFDSSKSLFITNLR